MPYVAEIKMFAGTFAPAGWMFCNGQLLPISENETLFNLIGTTYGGDGQETFALPDLRGRLPLHQGGGFTLAETGGVETITLTTTQIPSHAHALTATGNLASAGAPAGQLPGLAQAATITPYGTDAPVSTLHPQAVTTAGGSQPHENCQPYLTVNYIISLFGQFPSQT
jgi:microcystin-dependent protein